MAVTLTQPAFTCSKLTLKTPERRNWRRSGVFIVNFEHVIAGWGGTTSSPSWQIGVMSLLEGKLKAADNI